MKPRLAPNVERLSGPRFLPRFACLADRCPDTCCKTWHVEVDAEHFAKLEAALLADPAEAPRLARAFLPDPSGKHHRLLVFNEQQRCHYLTPTETCELHARFGEPVLGDTCSMYPRFVQVLDGVPEASARLSCPEVARLVLLADDALEPIVVDRAAAGRGVIAARLRSTADGNGFLDVLRQSLASLLDRDAPLVTRLYHVGYLATRFDGLESGTTLNRASLLQERAALDAPDTQRELDAALAAALATTESVAPAIVTLLLSSRLRCESTPSFDRLADRVLRHELQLAGLAAPTARGEGYLQLGAERLAAHHAARRTALAPALASTLDRALANFVRYNALYDTFRFPTLLPWFLDLAVWIALMRYLILAALALGDPLEQAIVDVTYTINRAFDHDRELLEELARTLEERDVTTLAHGVSLLHF